MKKILLIGKEGQIGWELQRSLSSLGEVAAFDRHSFDLSQPDRMREIIRSYQPNIIVNASAYTAVDKAEAEKELAFTVNAQAPGLLAEEAQRHNSLLVHYSTDYVFDGCAARP
jgi:dTDP-4-dehydrorhamnose reductase